jgi:ADP-ribosylglycohydrolase
MNRFKGALLGLATGDAVGTTLEFTQPGQFESITDMIGGGPFGLEPGQWTDDTSMALCLAESLIECEGFDLHDQARRYVRWFREGYLSSTGECFDIGNTVHGALTAFEATGQISGATGKYAAGNGSLMRLAPVPMFYVDNPKEAIEKSGLSSTVTHDNAAAIDACRYFGGLIVGALDGVTKEELLSPGYSPPGKWSEGELVPEIYDVAIGKFKHADPRGTGYVVASLQAALWAFWKSGSFLEGCLAAANLGEDADTTAAVYGQLAGAYYGVDGIPARWLDKLAYRDLIEDFATKLAIGG